MAVRMLLVVVASWCLVSVAVGLTLCRAICWARGTDTADETRADPVQSAAQTRPAVVLPAPRSQDALLDLSALDGVATTGSSEQHARPVEA